VKFSQFINELDYEEYGSKFLKLIKSYGGQKVKEFKVPNVGKKSIYVLSFETKEDNKCSLTINREPYAKFDISLKYVYYISECTLDGEKLPIGHKEYFKEDSQLLRKFELLFKTLKGNLPKKKIADTVKMFVTHNTSELG